MEEKFHGIADGMCVDDNTPAMISEDTLSETIAKRNNSVVNPSSDSIHYCGVIDVDNAKWNKGYAKRMEDNLERFKNLGLYSALQEMGIIYDERQFRKSHVISTGSDGKQVALSGNDDSYDEAERQFDEMMENESKRETTKKDIVDVGNVGK